MKSIPDGKRFFQASRSRVSPFSAKFHPSVQNWSALRLIYQLVLGKNRLWKQEVTLGRKTNQQFVQIPHARFLDLLTYKAKQVGIRVVIQEESYTSKASFLDRNPIPIFNPKKPEKPL